MPSVRITGWRRDASKAAADRAISELSGLDPTEAERAVEKVMQGGSVTITMPSEKLAVELSVALRGMNFDARAC